MDMVKKIGFTFLILISLFRSEAISASLCSNIQASVISGFGYTQAENGENVWLAIAPEPGLKNNFTTGGSQHNSFLLGLALEKTCLTNLNNFESALGIEMDYLSNTSLTGVVHPMVNVAPDFDRLNYSYSMKSYLLLATAKLNKPNILPRLGAYLQGGIGGASNQLSNYTETSPRGSSAAPMLAPFGDETNANFAYFAGAGISFQINKHIQFLTGYRYVNSGSASFKPSPIQQTNDTLDFSFGHHFLIFDLAV